MDYKIRKNKDECPLFESVKKLLNNLQSFFDRLSRLEVNAVILNLSLKSLTFLDGDLL